MMMTAMLKASAHFPTEFWTDYEATRYREHMGENWLPPADLVGEVPPRSTGQRPDPLAGMTAKQIFIDCVWISDESSTTKLFLICIARFFDKNARGSSMSYAQIAADCSFSEPTSKRAAKDARERWLKIGVNKGFKTASGPQNLYDGTPPIRWVEELRRRKAKGLPIEPDPSVVAAAEGVSQRYPFAIKGYQTDTPSTQGVSQTIARGITRDTLTPITPTGRGERGADAPSPADAGTIQSVAASSPLAAPSSSARDGYCPSHPSALPPRVARSTKAKAAPDADVDVAHGLYNEEARRHGFFVCQALTGSRRARLAKRLKDIGGVEAFARALSVIPSDDFLMGRKAPRDGRDRFKLDIDRLLQTDGNMGDVLAKLLDRVGPAIAAEPSARPETVAGWRFALQRLPDGPWPPDFGPEPDKVGSLVPRELMAEPYVLRFCATQGNTQ
jgi:hypothetical protein